MTVSSNISFFSQTNTQSSRLLELRSTIDTLQRQATTQKKYDNFAGFGTESFNLQRLRGDQPLIQSYIDNIEKVSTRMDLMNKSMTKISEVGSQLVSAIHLQLTGGQVDMDTINQLASDGLKFVEDLMNQTMDGHYLFAGSDVGSMPFIDHSILNANFQNQVTGWLAGTITNTQIITTTDAFSAANLGLSSGLATAGSVTARISQNLDVDYTVKADEAGFQDIVRALSFAATLKFPDETTDVATQAQFTDVLDHILTVATTGVQEMNDSTQALASKFILIKSIRENHVSDLGLITTQIDKIENADQTAVFTSLQALSTQLTASYQVTKIVNDLSLVNFI